MSRIYLDNNSTTFLLPEVAEAMARYQRDHVGNPASAHRRGAQVRKILEDARAVVAQCLGAFPDEVVFTSGATEANNLALFGLAGSYSAPNLFVSDLEHPSVIEPCRVLTQQGMARLEMPVDTQGYLLPLTGGQGVDCLITVQLANHETGTIQNVSRVRKLFPQAAFHTDATQAVGKIAVDFHQLDVSTLACSAHKFHGPPGVGVLLVKRGVRLAPRSFGGHQQSGIRPGTEPVALAMGLATALELASTQSQLRQSICIALRQTFLDQLRTRVDNIVINGDTERGLPHVLNLSFPGCASDSLFIRLDLAGIDCSTGSACSSGSLLASPVLRAMGLPADVQHSSIRFSLSHLLTREEVLDAANRIAHEVNTLRQKPVLDDSNHPQN